MNRFAVKKKAAASANRRSQPSGFGYRGSGVKAQQAKIRHILRFTGSQAKLAIGQPNDKYEQEADRVADQLMRMDGSTPLKGGLDRTLGATRHDPKLQRQPESEEEEETLQTKPLADQITPLVQRQEGSSEEEEAPAQAKFKAGGIPQRKCPGCEEGIAQRQLMTKEDEQLQTKSKPSGTASFNPYLESRINSVKGGGQALDPATRNFFEPRFGCDFSSVRVHTDGNALELARSINARAFTLKNNIIMGTGEHQPHSDSGIRLLGHELTHVVQQGGHRLLQNQGFATGGMFKTTSLSGTHANMIGSIATPDKDRIGTLKTIPRIPELSSQLMQRQANVVLGPRPGPRQPRQITLAGNVPAAGARGRQAPMTRTKVFAIAFWQDNGAINNFVNYFQRTLGVAITLVPNLPAMFRTLRNHFQRVTRPRSGMTSAQMAALRAGAQILRLVVVAHRGTRLGSIGSGQTTIIPAQVMNQPDAVYVRNNVLAPGAGVEFWACNIRGVSTHLRRWAGVSGTATRAVRRGYFQTRRIHPYRRRAITSHPNNVIRAREVAANVLHGGVPVRHTRDVFNNPNLYLQPRYRKIQRREIRRFRRWLVKVYRFLERVGAIKGPTRTRGRRRIRVRLSKRERRRAVAIIFNRSQGEIRYAVVSHRRRRITPASRRLWRRIWIVRQ
jgi:hypothetical protein